MKNNIAVTLLWWASTRLISHIAYRLLYLNKIRSFLMSSTDSTNDNYATYSVWMIYHAKRLVNGLPLVQRLHIWNPVSCNPVCILGTRPMYIGYIYLADQSYVHVNQISHIIFSGYRHGLCGVVKLGIQVWWGLTSGSECSESSSEAFHFRALSWYSGYERWSLC